MNRDRVMLWSAVAVLAVLQGWALQATWHPAPHPGGDNAGYVALAQALTSGQGYTEVWDPATPPHTKYPPVFPALLAVAVQAGAVTWAGLKVVPLLFAGLAVAGVFLWGRARRGPVWGGAVALLTGWSATLLYHSHYLLSDVPFLAFTIGALWLLEERRLDPSGPATAPDRAGDARSEPALGEGSPAPVAGAQSRFAPAGLAVALALGCAGLAYFTRSAGLPLIVAVLAVLALRRRWRAAGLGAAVLAVPGVAWLLRAQGAVGDGAYLREFWMVDPYQPQLGEIGPLGLLPRALENAAGYLSTHLPAALTGPGGDAAWMGLTVGVLAVVGWGLAVRRRVGVTELFAPLYAGLILVWPVVWSGDRFALPLIPLALVYAGEALAWGMARVRREAVVPALAAAAAVLILAEGAALTRAADESASCRGAVRAGGPWACSGLGMVQFAEAARWAGANLPPTASVLTRKPRIWYAMSGLTTRTYPFVPYPDSVLAVAERAGAAYVVLDLVGSQAQLLATAVGARPGAFCSIAGFGGGDGGPRTELLGIVPTSEEGAGADAGSPDEVRIRPCPDVMRGAGAGLEPYTSSSPIPILRSSPSP